MEKMRVSKMAKRYIQAIDREAKERFDRVLDTIRNRIRDEVLKSSLTSGYVPIRIIIDEEMRRFVGDVIAVFDYYVEGIYQGGKDVSRRVLRLGREGVNDRSKHALNHNDRLFIDRYRSDRLPLIEERLNSSVVDYLLYKITTYKINGQWFMDGDEDYRHFVYKKQRLDDDDVKAVMTVIDRCFDSTYDEFIEYVAREAVVLYRRAQINEYKNLGIHVITFLADDDESSCPVCSARSDKIYPIDAVINDMGLVDGIKHAFCKLWIYPVISYRNQVTYVKPISDFTVHTEYAPYNDDRDLFIHNGIVPRIDIEVAGVRFVNMPIEIEDRVKRLMDKVRIQFPFLLRRMEFNFVDNITDVDEWLRAVERHYVRKGKNHFEANVAALRDQDRFKFKIATFNCGDIVYVSPMSFDSQPVENVLIREIARPLMGPKVDDRVKQLFNEKYGTKHVGHGSIVFESQFSGYLGEDSPENFLLESFVTYVVHPNKLRLIDGEVYEYIEKNFLIH